MEQFAKILGADENLINDAKLSRDVKDFYSILNESVVRASYPCIGIIFGKKCVPEQSMWLQNHFSRIAGNYLRPPSLRHLAQQFGQIVMQDQSILAVHWRYDEDWFSLCRPAAANALSQEHRKLCTALLCLLKHKQPNLLSQTGEPHCQTLDTTGPTEFAKAMLTPVMEFMVTHQMQAIYLVTPGQSLHSVQKIV